MGFAASQSHVVSLIQRRFDEEEKLESIRQRRLNLADRVAKFYEIHPREEPTLSASAGLRYFGHNCRRLFQAILETVRRASPSAGLRAELEHQQQRFDLWAKNLGLYRGGHSSLDYRFRDAPLIYSFTMRLLKDVGEFLLIIKQNLNSSHHETNVEGVAKYESDDDSDDLDSYGTESSDSIALQSLSSTIDRLYRVSFKIRNPALRVGSSRARDYDERYGDPPNDISLFDKYKQHDLDNVREVLKELRSDQLQSTAGSREQQSPPRTTGSSPEYLVNRLAHANVIRRKQFRYWWRHHLSVSTAGVEAVIQKRGRDPHESTPMTDDDNIQRSQPEYQSSLSTATAVVDENLVNLEDQQSVFSTSSLSWIEGESEAKVDIPTLPNEFKEKDAFECPYCYILCPRSMSKDRNWKTHVLRDLRPYLCLQKGCNEGEILFATYREWEAHERGHYAAGNIDRGSELSIGLDASSRTCILCGKFNAQPSHVAQHLQRTALFALPKVQTEDENSTLEDAQSHTSGTAEDESADTTSDEEETSDDENQLREEDFENSPAEEPALPDDRGTAILGRINKCLAADKILELQEKEVESQLKDILKENEARNVTLRANIGASFKFMS